ncbi:MAG: hypothetical protein RLY93_15115 [Sumerlaeia bacterium]
MMKTFFALGAAALLAAGTARAADPAGATLEILISDLGMGAEFIYIADGADPMIPEWKLLRTTDGEAVTASDLLAQVRTLMDSRQRADWTAARNLLEVLLADPSVELTDAERAEAQDLLARITTHLSQHKGVIIPGPGEGVIELPEWVRNNTIGVVYDVAEPENSFVLIANDIQAKGDVVDAYPSIVVKDILPGEVVFEYEGVEFPVSVGGSVVGL